MENQKEDSQTSSQSTTPQPSSPTQPLPERKSHSSFLTNKLFLITLVMLIVFTTVYAGIYLSLNSKLNQITKPNPTPTPYETANEIDYHSCKDLEKLPFQYVESFQFAIGYLDMSGIVELRSDGKMVLGSDQEVNGIYLKIPIQKTGEKGLFYSQFIQEAKGGSANAGIEGENLLFRLGEYDDKSVFSSEATIPQNFHSEIEKALRDKKIINLHLVISLPPSRDAPSNTSGACKIDIF